VSAVGLMVNSLSFFFSSRFGSGFGDVDDSVGSSSIFAWTDSDFAAEDSDCSAEAERLRVLAEFQIGLD